MKSLSRKWLPLVASVMLLSCATPALAQSTALLYPAVGRVLLAEQRFEPTVQRLLAQQSLNALPIAGGVLFYIVPAGLDARDQQDQIRYLEYLLDKRALQDAMDAEAGKQP